MMVFSFNRAAVVCALPVFLFGVVAPVTHAAVELDDKTTHYTISGTSAADLRREMNARGPSGSGGRRFDGYTRWHVNWRYWYRQSGGQCYIDRVQTSASVTITLPTWQNESSANSGLRAQWQRYLGALTQHEMGHRQHGIDAANEIDRAIQTLPPQASCDALGAQANARGQEIIRKYNQRDLDYDRDTQHGATQGARFP